MPRTACDPASPPVRLNLAVGLFDRPGQAQAAVTGLRQRNLELARCRFVVAGDSSVFCPDVLLQSSADMPVECVSLSGLSVDRAWSELVIAKALDGGTMPARSHEAVCDTTAAILARQNQRLMKHLASGGGVLVVGLADQAQQQTAAGLLLRLASGVFTHQLRAPRIGSESDKGVYAAKAIECSPRPARAI